MRLPSGYWPTSEASGIVIFFRVPEGKRPWHVVVLERLVLKHQNFLSVPFLVHSEYQTQVQVFFLVKETDSELGCNALWNFVSQAFIYRYTYCNIVSC